MTYQATFCQLRAGKLGIRVTGDINALIDAVMAQHRIVVAKADGTTTTVIVTGITASDANHATCKIADERAERSARERDAAAYLRREAREAAGARREDRGDYSRGIK